MTPKYALLHYPQAPPAAQTSVTLPFVTIAAIIAAPLPVTAYTTGLWVGSTAIGLALQRAQWRARVPRGQGGVTFVRTTAAPRHRLDHAGIVAAYQAGMPLRTIQTDFHVSASGIFRVLRRAGVPLRGRH